MRSVAVIFDLDQTLVDSSVALSLRGRRLWDNVYELIPSFQTYDGIDDILSWLKMAKVSTCIVTNSPKSYCIRVVNKFGWSFDAMVCYHDTSLHKPHPAPIKKAIEKLNIDPPAAISVGDEAKDVIASRRAGVATVGALWGSDEAEAVLRESPDYLCKSPKDLKLVLAKRLGTV